MKIFDISIKNFRGIDELNELSSGDVNSFVGKNDSGKSNILKALNTFFNEKFDSKDVYKAISEGEKTEIILRFTPEKQINKLALDLDGKIKLKKTFEFNPSGKVVKNFSYISNDIDNTDYLNCWGINETGINNYCSALGLEYSRSGRGVTNLSKIELIEGATGGMGRLEKEHNGASDFLKNLKKQYDFIELPTYSLFDAEQDLNISSTSFQGQFKEIAIDSLGRSVDLTNEIELNVKRDLESEFSEIAKLMKKNVPDLERINTDPICNWGNLVKFDLSLKFGSENYDISMSNKGTGFKKLLMVAYFEHLASKNTRKHQIFGIEEPETFLHPELQHDFLSSILELSENSQFFITTHSPVFAGSTKDSNIVVVKKDNGLSKYFNYENKSEILDMVIQELGIKPAYNLLNDNYRKAIFVEGSGDIKFWEIALTKIKGEIPQDILFIPCGGSQVDFFVNAELCKKINRRFIVVIDSDNGATDYIDKVANASKIEAKVLELGGEMMILKKREVENYYNREAIQRILGTEYQLPEAFQITDYNDIKEEMKTHILEPTNLSLKTKNNANIFNEMTREEWISSGVVEGETTDLEQIIDKILES